MPQKTILITGASSGLGFEAAKQLAQKEHRLILLCRNREKAEHARAEITAHSGNTAIDIYTANLAAHASVKNACDQIRKDYDSIDVLLNNAGGVFSNFELSEDGIEMTMANNHFNYFWVSYYLYPLLRDNTGRIINVASDSHYAAKTVDPESFYTNKGYFIMKAYEQSKLANVLFTHKLAELAKSRGITVNALHPGFVHTPIGGKSENWLHANFWNLASKLFAQNVEKGAQTHIYLADSDAVNGVSGKYFHNSQAKRPSGVSLDPKLQDLLWRESERMSGFSFDGSV